MTLTIITTSVTARADDPDQTFIAAPGVAADLVVTLPPANSHTKGHKVRLIVGAVSAVAGHSLKPGNATDKIRAHGVTEAVNKKLICTHGTENVGDATTLTSDGNGHWYAGLFGTWAREA